MGWTTPFICSATTTWNASINFAILTEGKMTEISFLSNWIGIQIVRNRLVMKCSHISPTGNKPEQLNAVLDKNLLTQKRLRHWKRRTLPNQLGKVPNQPFLMLQRMTSFLQSQLPQQLSPVLNKNLLTPKRLRHWKRRKLPNQLGKMPNQPFLKLQRLTKLRQDFDYSG